SLGSNADPVAGADFRAIEDNAAAVSTGIPTDNVSLIGIKGIVGPVGADDVPAGGLEENSVVVRERPGAACLGADEIARDLVVIRADDFDAECTVAADHVPLGRVVYSIAVGADKVARGPAGDLNACVIRQCRRAAGVAADGVGRD